MDELANAAVKHNLIIGIFVMFDTGLHRCGVADPGQIVRLAQYAETHRDPVYEKPSKRAG